MYNIILLFNASARDLDYNYLSLAQMSAAVA